MFGNLTPVVKNLLIINIVIFAVEYLLGINFAVKFGLYYIFSNAFAPYQFITHLFLHGSGWHLFGNMFGLFIFGPLLERVWGSQRFLFYYFFTGLGASVLYMAVDYYEVSQVQSEAEYALEAPSPDRFSTFMLENLNPPPPEIRQFIDRYYDNPNNASLISQSKEYIRLVVGSQENGLVVGASGAIFGILLAFGMLFPNTELFLLFFPFPIKAKYFVLFYGLYELWTGFQRVPGDNVAHFAHLGGMLFGFILIKLWKDKRSTFY